ncbi:MULTISPECIES: hypothetical protein [Halobacterium]|uniref:DUF7282 domain-containing protein n=1 Tax=Halobacterium TaxID=2239 RepID=UPI00073E272A|nr:MULTISPECIES: hypothetical protein [Halobacterium]MCG1002118.1 hypothetical protein [Halobacterium noricense]
MERTRFVPVVAALVLVAAALAGVAPVAAQQESASVGDYTVTRGETVSISVSHSSPANLTISGGGFEVLVGFGGGGTSTIEFDTYRSDGETAGEFISGGAPDLKGPPLDEAIQPGEYDLKVTIDGQVEAYGTLTVLPNGEVTGETGALRGDYFEGDGGGNALGAVQTHAEIGRGNDNVVVGDYAAFVFEENDSGIGAPFGGDATLGALAGEGFEVRVEELDPEPNTRAETYTVEDLRASASFGGSGDGRLAVLWDTSGIELGSGSNHTYEFELSVNETRNPLFSESQTLLTERVTLVEPSVRISADPGYTLAPWNGDQMAISGETNLLPGTTLNVRALHEDGEPPRIWQDNVQVGQSGAFGTTLDFSNAERPAQFPLWVQNYESETRTTVRLTAAKASLLFPAQVVDNGTVTVERLTLSRGGFLRLTANNETVGTTGSLPQMTNGSVDVQLNTSLTGPTNVTATAIVDANENGQLDADDPVYETAGSPVSGTALVESTVTEPNTTTTNTTQTTAQPTSTTVTLHVNDEEPLAPVANNGGGSGGFVPLSPVTTLVAVAAALLLAARRGPDRL